MHLRDGLNEAMSVARAANRYLDEQAPWKRIKTDREGAATTVYTMIQVLNGMKVLFAPYVPFSSQKAARIARFLWQSGRTAPGMLEEVPASQALPVPTPLFAKFDPPIIPDDGSGMN